MLDALRFVQGAVAKKDFVPSLTHFHIDNGVIRGYNGRMALCSPIDLHLQAAPKAIPFVKAIQTCKETVTMHLTESNRLSVKSGVFKAFVDCADFGEYPNIQPEGVEVQIPAPEEFFKALSVVAKFTAEDASRPWAQGVLFRGHSAYATNNVVIVEHWMPVPFPVEVNIPKAAVQEILRIGEAPMSFQATDTSITFNFSGNRWLRTQTYEVGWPDVSKILDQQAAPATFPEGFFNALADLKPFLDKLEAVAFRNGALVTAPAEGAGASVEIPGLPEDGTFNHKFITMLDGIATHIDFSKYPGPCVFYGNMLRGAIIGMRPIEEVA